MKSRRTLLAVAITGIGCGTFAVTSAPPAHGQARTAQQAQQQQQQQQQGDQDRRQNPPPAPATPRLGAPIPQDSRVPLPPDVRPSIPSDTRPPLGTTKPPATVNRPPGARPGAAPARPGTPEQPGDEAKDQDEPPSDRDRGDRQDRDGFNGRRGDRHGDGFHDEPGGAPAGHPRPVPYYRDYWVYDPYWGAPYQQPYREDWRADAPIGAPPEDWRDDRNDWDAREARNQDGRPVAPGARGTDLGEATVPLLPPDEVLGDAELTPALKKLLDASPDWRQATAELIRAWSDYAQAANRVLGEVRRTPEYRKALADYKRAQVRVEQLQGQVPAAGRANAAAADRLLPAADAAIQARRAVRSTERDALTRDPQVRNAQRRVDAAVDRRNDVRAKVAARLPEADRAPRRPRLLDE